MEIYNYFIEDYKLIEANCNEQYEVIEAFLDELEEGKEQKYIEPLKAVFIHNTKSEMFLILNWMNYDIESIKNVCDKWENKVLEFVNFGNEYRQFIKWLKYNISLLILCKDEIGDIDDNYRYQTEKSTQVCRKIFLLCNDRGEIIDDEKSIIPFYFEPIKTIDSKEKDELEKQLEELLPKDPEIKSICKKERLTDDDINKMCGWLKKYANK